VDRSDRGLQLVGAGLVAAQAAPDQLLALADHGRVPELAVLVGQPHQRAVRPGAGRAAGGGQQQQSEQPHRLRLVGHQLLQQPGQPHRFGTEVVADQVRTTRRGVPLVEDQVDDGQDGPEPVRELPVVGDPDGDPGRLDLALGAHQALSHRGLGHQERPGDLGGLQAGDEAQGQGHLGGLGQCRVAAGEDQAELVVVHAPHLQRVRVVGVRPLLQQRRLHLAVVALGLAAQSGRWPGCGRSS